MFAPSTSTAQAFLQGKRNHAELRRLLHDVGLASNLAPYDEFVREVARTWFALGRHHQAEAEAALRARLERAAISRAYYAAYSVSKSVRYLVRGTVSLRGDDHRAVGDLPDDFPTVPSWARRLPELREHRLRADYENWGDTSTLNTLTPNAAVQTAADFIKDASNYLASKVGLCL